MHEQCRTFQTWNDYKLRWSPEEYAGIKDIRYPSPGNIWKPDILLYNSADEKFDSTFPVNFVVSHNGDVLQAPPGIVKCSCDVDITWFPFDDQICFLKFGSWTYSVMKLDLQIDKDGLNETHEMDLQYYVENGEWILIRTPTRREEDPFAEEPYVQLYFYFHIRRRTLYYGLNWIIPSVLISLMTVLGFTLPPEAGEKITLVAFFSSCMMVVSASVVFTVLVLNLHHRQPGSHEMNAIMRSVMLEWMPWLLMMRRPGKCFRRPQLPFSESSKRQAEDSVIATRLPRIESKSLPKSALKNSDAKQQQSTEEQERLLENGFRCEDADTHCDTCKQLRSVDQGVVDEQEKEKRNNDEHEKMQTMTAELRLITTNVRRLNDQLHFITERMQEDDEIEDGQRDWKFAAMVVDRFCLYLFTVFIVVSTCGIMFSAPHLSA
uniref:Uncharacterized protein n=1 Tax=Plectus sambesii TaxID=2011161 RepID=A0A914WSI7_9BILA